MKFWHGFGVGSFLRRSSPGARSRRKSPHATAVGSFGRLGQRQALFQPLEERTLLAVVNLQVLDSVAEEKASNTGTVQITRDNTTGSLQVYFSISGTATNGTDYSSIASPVVMNAGVGSVNVVLTPTNDGNTEGSESAVFTLTADAGYTLGQNTQGTINIADNDPAVNIGDVALEEPESGSVNAVFTISLAYATDYNFNVSWATAAGTATAGSDYTTSSGSVTFTAGQTSKTVSVPVLADTAQEGDETFYVNITPPSGLTGDHQGLGTIRDASTFAVNGRVDENPSTPANLPEQLAGSLGQSVDAFSGDYVAALPVAGDPAYLIYHSDTSQRPIVVVESALKSGQPVPTSIEAQLTFNGVAGPVVYYSTGGLSAGSPLRFALQADATALATGRYAWSMTVTARYGGASYYRTFAGNQNVVNWAGSEFGAGWSVRELDRLYPATGGVLYVRGDGLALWFADNGAGGFNRPAEDASFGTLTLASGVYTLKDKYGNGKSFTSAGLMTTPFDPYNNSGSYQYTDGDGDSQVDEIWKITDAAGRLTTFAYSGGKLDYIDDFASRRSEVTVTSGKLVTFVQPDPDGAGAQTASTTAFAYSGPDGRLSQITDPAGRATGLAYDFAKRLDVITNPDSTTWLVDPAQTKGLVDLATSGSAGNPAALFTNLANAYARVVDPRSNATSFTSDYYSSGYRRVG